MIDAPGSTDPLLAPDKASSCIQGTGFAGWSRIPPSSKRSMRARSTRSWIATAAAPCCCPKRKARCTIRVASCSARSMHCPEKSASSTRSGVVVMANKAWRVSGAAHARAGLDVRAGENFFAACRDAPESERAHADAVAAGLRKVLDRHAPVVALPICLPLTPRTQCVHADHGGNLRAGSGERAADSRMAQRTQQAEKISEHAAKSAPHRHGGRAGGRKPPAGSVATRRTMRSWRAVSNRSRSTTARCFTNRANRCARSTFRATAWCRC